MLRVWDDGPGVSSRSGEALREGVGLANTRARLRHVYGDAHSLRYGDAPGGGFAVELRIPYRKSGAQLAGEGGAKLGGELGARLGGGKDSGSGGVKDRGAVLEPTARRKQTGEIRQTSGTVPI